MCIRDRESTDQEWEYKKRHASQTTDVFRIANNKQLQVKLRLKVRAYNILTEQFPMSKNYLDPDALPNHYIFQAKVNADFYGLPPFILSNHDFLDILGPPELTKAVQAAAAKILEKY